MSPRKSTGKRLRFSVFHRDHFTCQYCGAQPPDAVLVVDHIEPVALGGGDGMENRLRGRCLPGLAGAVVAGGAAPPPQGLVGPTAVDARLGRLRLPATIERGEAVEPAIDHHVAAATERHDVVGSVIEGVIVSVVTLDGRCSALMARSKVTVERAGTLPPLAHRRTISLPGVVLLTPNDGLIRPRKVPTAPALIHVAPHTTSIPDSEACNQGKASRSLGDKTVRPDADLLFLETQQEIAELRRYQGAASERDAVRREVIGQMQDRWAEITGTDRVPADHIVLHLLNRYGPDITEDALTDVALKIGTGYLKMSGTWVAYLNAVARNMAADEEEG